MEERHKCKLCWKSFANGRALGGHMRSHMLPSQPESASSSMADPLQDRESETESSKKPTRKRSRLNRRSNEEGKSETAGAAEVKIGVQELSESCTEQEPMSSVCDAATEEEDVALSLMLLSRDKWEKEERGKNNKWFECETCEKVFKSYQALGEHRASHRKRRAETDQLVSDELKKKKKKTSHHECPICSKVFSSGQALGGHKRSHASASNDESTIRRSGIIISLIDLNLPAPSEEEDMASSRLIRLLSRRDVVKEHKKSKGEGRMTISWRLASSTSLLSIHRTPTSAFISAMTFSSSSSSSSLELVLEYHNQTKHSFTGYARGPRGLDWANQPNPFRRYLSAPLLPLQHPNHDDDDNDDSPLYSCLFDSLPPPKPISLATISHLFYHSLALSAWKTTGSSTWPLRVNPSSGNLHPTEAYLIAPPIPSLSQSAFVAHYAPKEHSLEVRAHIPSSFFPENSFLIGISSIFWREAWKYGERAFRYCNHDVGHAIAALSIAAAELGWDLKLLDGFGADDLKRLMGLPEFQIPSSSGKGKLPEIEFEHPDCLLLVFPNGTSRGDLNLDYLGISSALRDFPSLEWNGNPNTLSKEHLCWDIIYRTAKAVEKPSLIYSTSSSFDAPFTSSALFSHTSYNKLTARQVVRTRRSAVDMDAVTCIDMSAFYQILMHCLPSGSTRGEPQKEQLALPFRALPWDTAEVHLALFVHRVLGLPKGLYFLVRNEDHLSDLKTATRPEFEWKKPDGCPADLPLYKLTEGDCQKLAKGLSCHQDIAGDGCFSLGMVARFEPALREKGSWVYPRLFWETGVIGQVLYLEAHAMGISATGIGCYFDDPVHEVLGIKDSSFQSLYHFTVGGPVVDKRIMTLPAYPGPTTTVA
ncbi:unnamed protein product [Arabidopsis lyrata]|uniref:C2H2-type domain-containing protein n=2 Tax=Arabidopsis lyrata subsp. lyrata TaxID=81972 RepID=D7KP50_ARALL|nr:hypothetical protein ARALYDRAFT_333455 [Arabidopsis lyrata subsp. lyrata]CAH8250771.1 unnamed protein product [Arabidopsis lyrata]